jgi:HAD superfamily hydrolase (TIGR01509 family)
VSGSRRFSLIVFDMDGVLTDSTGCHARAFADLWAEIGLERPPAYPDIAGRPTDSVVRQYTGSLHPDAAAVQRWVRFKQERARAYLAGTGGFPDALPVVTALARAGYRLALGTGASRHTTSLLLSQAGLDPFFPVVITGEDVKRGKPAPDTFVQAIQQAGGHPASSLVVEDSSAGLAAGLAAGAFAASVRTGEAMDHDRFIGTFADLTELLAALTGPAA